jgi:hypothetical protein
MAEFSWSPGLATFSFFPGAGWSAGNAWLEPGFDRWRARQDCPPAWAGQLPGRLHGIPSGYSPYENYEFVLWVAQS